MVEVGAVFPPLAGAMIAGLFGRSLGDRGAQGVTIGLMVIAAMCGIILFVDVAVHGNARTVDLATWIASGSLEARWSLRFDTLSAVMVGMVTVVSTLIHVYSVGYMSHDSSIPRFMAYLSLFTFAMLMLVTADDLIQLFFGWEGVGLASYLLIGFWFDRESANAAAMKAFIVNRVGDVGFALGIAGVFALTNSVAFDGIFIALPGVATRTISAAGMEFRAVELCAVLLFIGAMGKSAQIFLHTWLPDAMEGPTPVSALIHAATMVTAGVFLTARMSPLFELAPTALAIVTVIGAATALFAATVGCVQNDIKRVIAYSTCSQLGYMFFAAGVSAYPAAIFHLFTHAFFKALLFLSAGSVIHAMDGEQDIRRMGAIWRKVPITYAMMWIGSLALAGVPIFAGYYSKDMVLEVAWASGTGVGRFAFACGLIAAFLTAFYSWRLLILTFHGDARADAHTMSHVHESPPVMTVPLALLAIGAVFAGVVFHEPFVGHHYAEFWREAISISPEHRAMALAHDVPAEVKYAPLVLAIAGIATAVLFYALAPKLPVALAEAFPGVYQFLLNKWYFDELYHRLFVRPACALGTVLWKGGDLRTIDRYGPDGVASLAREIGRSVVRVQSGYVYHYAFTMLVGLVVLVTLAATGRL